MLSAEFDEAGMALSGGNPKNDLEDHASGWPHCGSPRAEEPDH